MFSYNLNECNRNIKSDVDKIVKLVYQYNGKMIGGYVRDYLIPKNDFKDNYNKNISPYLKVNKYMTNIIQSYIEPKFESHDLDIWFIDNEDRDDFLEELNYSYYYVDITDEARNRYYPIGGKRYMIMSTLEKNEQLRLGLDLLVSEVFPVNDFSINLLSYDGNNFKVEEILTHYSRISYFDSYHCIILNKYCYYTKPLEFTLETILFHIRNKKLVLLYDYFDTSGIENLHHYLGPETSDIIRCQRYIKFTQEKGYEEIPFTR